MDNDKNVALKHLINQITIDLIIILITVISKRRKDFTNYKNYKAFIYNLSLKNTSIGFIENNANNVIIIQEHSSRD